MIEVSVNGVISLFNKDKEAQLFLEGIMKDHLTHPYFFNVKKIKDNNVKILEIKYGLREGDTYYYIKKIRKLESDRNRYLRSNPDIVKPKSLKVEINHTY